MEKKVIIKKDKVRGKMTDEEFVEYAEEENTNGKGDMKKNGDKVKEAYDKFKRAI